LRIHRQAENRGYCLVQLKSSSLMANAITMPTEQSRMRIVPLYKGKRKVRLPQAKEPTDLFAGDAPAPPADTRLTYNGGVLLQNAAVYTIFWGNGWSADAVMNPMMQQINQFFSDILVSPLIDQLSEYNVAGKYSIGHGTLAGSKVILAGAPQPGNSVDDNVIRAALKGWITAGEVTSPTANTLYFVYLDNQVTVSMEGSGSCKDFCGYHDAIDGNIFYAAMPYPSCDGCLAGLSVLDALTGTSSHELCEAITDPAPPNGWYDSPNNMEIGDICAWTFKEVSGHNVQKEWSNAANACI
jgi:hypothetical protein